jgi:hypothetical protein
MFHKSCDVQGRWCGYIWGRVLFIIMMGMFLLLGRIWGYVYLQRYHSFVIFVYLNFICGVVQVYLVTGLSFQCVIFLMFGPLCYMCVLYQVYVEYFAFCLYLWLGYVLYVGFYMYILFVLRIWVDIRCILIDEMFRCPYERVIVQYLISTKGEANYSPRGGVHPARPSFYSGPWADVWTSSKIFTYPFILRRNPHVKLL